MRKNKILWGILLLVAAVGILLFALMPELSLISIPLWKWLAGVVLLYWLLKNAVFGQNLREHLCIFLPLGLLFMVFEKEIARCLGRSDDLANNWLILSAAVLLTAAVCLLFGKGVGVSKHHHNRLASSVYYLDVQENKKHTVSNSLGETVVFCQNTDVGDNTAPVYLDVNNRLGDTTIHIPPEWSVSLKADNHLGNIQVRPNPLVSGREFILTGSNRLGEINVVSP